MAMTVYKDARGGRARHASRCSQKGRLGRLERSHDSGGLSYRAPLGVTAARPAARGGFRIATAHRPLASQMAWSAPRAERLHAQDTAGAARQLQRPPHRGHDMSHHAESTTRRPPTADASHDPDRQPHPLSAGLPRLSADWSPTGPPWPFRHARLFLHALAPIRARCSFEVGRLDDERAV